MNSRRPVNIHFWNDSIASSFCHLFAWKFFPEWKHSVVSISVPPLQLWGGEHTELCFNYATVFSRSVTRIRLSHITFSIVALIGPSDAPTITGLTPVTVTSLVITWDPPPQPSWNGPLTGYSIQFRQLPGNGFMEETVAEDMTEHELLNLVRYQNYEVQLAALNGKGLGPYSTPQFVYIGEAGENTCTYSQLCLSRICISQIIA